VDWAVDAKEALNKFEKNSYRLIISDIMMPEIDGFKFLDELRKMKIQSPVIMTTGYSTVENAVRSLYNGAIDFIPKPFTSDELLNSVIRGIKYLEIQNSINNSPKDDAEIFYVPCPAKYFRLGYSSWAWEESSGSVLIGATDLFLKTIDTFTDLEFFKIEDEVIQGNPSAFINDKQGRMHPLLSPISGRIIEVNLELMQDNSIIEKDPYFQGWFYRLIPSNIEYELKNLINCSSDRL
jgi:CheY-like chemotaxis protein